MQLWPTEYAPTIDGEFIMGWSLRYWVWEPGTVESRQVQLPGLRVDCLGQVALVLHGEAGVEVGGPRDAVNWAFWVPWGGHAGVLEPSDALLESVASRPSNVAVDTEGDLVRVGTGPQAQSYAMRDPLRPDGARWNVQARHDGEVFMLTVHPAHLPCFSGVTWVSLADTGELIACGANSAATAFVAPEPPTGEPVLPEPEHVGTYLSCPAPLTPY
ncbi:MAG: hypothetical protein OXL98_11180 [Acidimicrobiaceae bacterium]|nr:hypothetical protein [Acidimicrobiaceae bacterium]